MNALMATRIQDVDEAPFTTITAQEEKMVRLGTVNSPAPRKLKYPSVHAAQNSQ